MPGGDDDVLGVERAVELLAVDHRGIRRWLDIDLVGRLEGSRALVDVDFVLAHEELDALDQAFAHLPAALVRDAVVQLEVVEAEPQFLALTRQDVGDLGVVDERLGRDAADVEAYAAEELALHKRHFQAQLGRTNRRHITAGPAADDGYIICRICH